MAKTLLMAIGLACCGPALAAVTVLQCQDENGLTYFADRCRPGNEQLGQRRLHTLAPPSKDLEEIAAQYPVTFYAIPECDACDLVRNQLQRHNIPFTEKNVSSDVELQTELKELAGGLTIPTVHVADHTITGYDKKRLDRALQEVGYPIASPADGGAGGG